MNPDQVSASIKRIATSILMTENPRKSRIAYHVKRLATQLYLGSAAKSLSNKISEIEERIDEAPSTPEAEEAKEVVTDVKADLEALQNVDAPVESPTMEMETLLEGFKNNLGTLCAALGEMGKDDESYSEEIPGLASFCNELVDLMESKIEEFRSLAAVTPGKDREDIEVEFVGQDEQQ